MSEQPVTNEGAVTLEPESIAVLEELKKQLTDLQQNYAIMEHTAKVHGDNLQRTQNENMALRGMLAEHQAHILTLCKAMGKVMT